MIMLDLIQPTAFVGAVGVEEINGLVQNAKGLVVQNARWAVYKYQMLVVQIPNAVNANAY